MSYRCVLHSYIQGLIKTWDFLRLVHGCMIICYQQTKSVRRKPGKRRMLPLENYLIEAVDESTHCRLILAGFPWNFVQIQIHSNVT